MSRVRMVILGCGTMPHVGEHPGTGFMLLLILTGAAAGVQNGGWLGALIGASIMGGGMGPFYLWGAYSRAKLSLRLSRDSGRHAQRGDPSGAPSEGCQSGGATSAASPTLSSRNPETPNDR